MPAKTITEKTIDSSKQTLTVVKEAASKALIGKTAITAVQKVIMDLPGLPDGIKTLISMPIYGEAITGVLLSTLVPLFTDNGKAAYIADAANVVGTTKLITESGLMTQIEEIIKNIGCINIPDESK